MGFRSQLEKFRQDIRKAFSLGGSCIVRTGHCKRLWHWRFSRPCQTSHDQFNAALMTITIGGWIGEPQKSVARRLSRILWFYSNGAEVSVLCKIILLPKDPVSWPKISVSFCHNSLNYILNNLKELASECKTNNEQAETWTRSITAFFKKKWKNKTLALEKQLTFKQDDKQRLSFCKTI